jgi:hypothetical protein
VTEVETRICKVCGTEDLLVNFPKDGKDAEGNQKYGSSCKECRNTYGRALKQQVKERNSVIENIYDVVKEKYCGQCKTTKPSIEFNKDVMSWGGLDYQCRECKSIYKNALYFRVKNELQTGVRKLIEITEKKCSTCQTVKPVEEIVKSIGSTGGHSYTCKPCAILIDTDRRDKLRILLENNERVYKEVQEKPCSVCNIVKNINEFVIDKWSADNHLSQCKSCVKERADPEGRKQYYQENREKILEDIRISGIQKRKRLRQAIIEKGGDGDQDTILYILKFKGYGLEYIKIGITGLSVYERYKTGYNGFEYDILHESYYNSRKAGALEQQILNDHEEANLKFEYPIELRSKFEGWTECVTKLHKGVLESYDIQMDWDNLNNLGLLHD